MKPSQWLALASVIAIVLVVIGAATGVITRDEGGGWMPVIVVPWDTHSDRSRYRPPSQPYQPKPYKPYKP